MKSKFLLCCLLAVLTSCVKTNDRTDPFPAEPAGRTLLVYIAADNNLASYAQENLKEIESTLTASGITRNNHVIAYLDIPNQAPVLMRMSGKQWQTVKQFDEEQNSASADVLREIIEETLTRYPAEKYSLILWSHGTSWLPANSTFLSKSFAAREALEIPTKAFGMDIGVTPTGYMEIAELKDAIPNGVFDYIIFDACYMGSAEVLYALKEKADYIISSPTEVLATGFPYERIMEKMLAENPDLGAICRDYYEYYNNKSNGFRSASVSLVRTAGLDELVETVGEATREALRRTPDLFDRFQLSSVQHFDTYGRHFAFDLDQFVETIATTPLYSEFQSALSRTVLFEAHTPSFFSTAIDRCCGLSVYIPVVRYDSHNAFYHTFDWAKTVYSR